MEDDVLGDPNVRRLLMEGLYRLLMEGLYRLQLPSVVLLESL